MKFRGPNHGQARTRLYGIWQGMKNRCYNPNVEKYPIYGARGIKVCPEWFYNFMAFRKWALENNYERFSQIDRIDNSKDYSPDNCRWVTPKEQQRNRTNTIYVTAFKETKPITEWMEDERCRVKPRNFKKKAKSWLAARTGLNTFFNIKSVFSKGNLKCQLILLM